MFNQRSALRAPRLVDDEAIAMYVGVSIATIFNWRRDLMMRFPHTDQKGLTDLNDIDAWLKRRKQ